MFTEPRQGWCRVLVRVHRTAIDWAAAVKVLLDEDYKTVSKAVLVCDNLNIHTPASLSKAFPAAKARRLAARLESLYPEIWELVEHGRDRVECLQTSMFGASDPGYRDAPVGGEGVAMPSEGRKKSVDLQFTAEDARTRLKRLVLKFKDGQTTGN